MTQRPTFREDVAFLRDHAETLVLARPGGGMVAVVPDWQGRVMTSAFDQDSRGFGWMNRRLIQSRCQERHINALGGEDRFWLGPEGGQFSVYFAPGAPFDFEHWQTPACIDTEPFEVVACDGTSASFRHAARLTNWSGTTLDIRIDRTVHLLDSDSLEPVGMPDVASRASSVSRSDLRTIAFESRNTITNAGDLPWSEQTGLLSIWILGMFEPSPSATVVLPFRAGPVADLGPIVNDDYFGRVSADRLKVRNRAACFKADGAQRGKIGLSAARSLAIAGSIDPDRSLLTLVTCTPGPPGAKYVNSAWRLQDDPYAGDVINSYNDGPSSPGHPPLGPFYELETSSPALPLAPGESREHVHRTWHLTGSAPDLRAAALRFLGTDALNL